MWSVPGYCVPVTVSPITAGDGHESEIIVVCPPMYPVVCPPFTFTPIYAPFTMLLRLSSQIAAKRHEFLVQTMSGQRATFCRCRYQRKT